MNADTGKFYQSKEELEAALRARARIIEAQVTKGPIVQLANAVKVQTPAGLDAEEFKAALLAQIKRMATRRLCPEAAVMRNTQMMKICMERARRKCLGKRNTEGDLGNASADLRAVPEASAEVVESDGHDPVAVRELPAEPSFYDNVGKQGGRRHLQRRAAAAENGDGGGASAGAPDDAVDAGQPAPKPRVRRSPAKRSTGAKQATTGGGDGAEHNDSAAVS